MTGFTNVVWGARPTKQLATDLGAGAGDGPLIAAALGWAQLSALLADVGVDYVRILAKRGIAWESASSDEAFGKLASFAGWFSDAAAAAADSAGRAGAQAAATTVARISMPGLPELQITEDIHRMAITVGAATGAPIGGVAADAERAALDQKHRAARVMETYEAATEPVARAWAVPHPAEIVSSGALAAEQAIRDATRVVPTRPEPTVGPVPGGTGGYAPASAPRRQTRYATTILAGSSATPATTQPAPASTNPRPAVPATPMAPMMGAPGQGGDTVARRGPVQVGAGIDPTARSGAADDGSSHHAPIAVAVDLGDHPDPRYRSGILDLPSATSVPAVLGATDQNR
ncbi:PPE domain-containing protein [Nocardia sp. 348MFTsu5.1]|uniref:PPE domain-containing protein n=1 Tax=Nocardia sp. 348MFTsu5.1 TaxID=1172185 RepID=UPI0003724C5D|nr:PPE domain-containing protein [Nocardia sp. 348MFTsu5.1]